MMRPRRLIFMLAVVMPLGCQSLDRFNTTNGAAYCGPIVSGQFIRTPVTEGGFDHETTLKVEIDTDTLTTTPGFVTSNDASFGPCSPQATFDHSPLRVTPEIVSDPLSNMTFEDGQVHNVLAWVTSTCYGTLFSVVSLYKNDRVEVRLMRPAGPLPAGGVGRDAFALFTLSRNDTGCGF